MSNLDFSPVEWHRAVTNINKDTTIDTLQQIYEMKEKIDTLDKKALYNINDETYNEAFAEAIATENLISFRILRQYNATEENTYGPENEHVNLYTKIGIYIADTYPTKGLGGFVAHHLFILGGLSVENYHDAEKSQYSIKNTYTSPMEINLREYYDFIETYTSAAYHRLIDHFENEEWEYIELDTTDQVTDQATDQGEEL
jgi:hypothetical protein